MPWFRRLGFHLVAAIGATGVFVAAAAVGANQTRPPTAQVASVQSAVPSQTRTPIPPRRTPAAVASPSPAPVRPERSLTGTIKEVQPDAIVIQMPKGVEWKVTPVPGALIRLNGKAAKLDALQEGDGVVVLGQALGKAQFLAHAITARRK